MSQVTSNQQVSLTPQATKVLSGLFLDFYAKTVTFNTVVLGVQSAEAEDITGECFARVAKSLACNSLPHSELTQGYFYKLSKSILIDKWRRAKVVNINNIESFVDSEGNEYLQVESNNGEADDMLLRRENKKELLDSFRAIKHSINRKCAIMYFIQEMKYSEIATALGISINTVKSGISRSRVLLQNQLDLA